MTGVFSGTFAAALKKEYAFIAAKEKEIDGMYRQFAEDMQRTRSGEPSTVYMHPEDYRAIAKGYGAPSLAQKPAPALTAAGVMALTTLAGMEWLRHRKNEIAAAEQSGDYSSLIDEFFEYLRALFRAWRVALGMEEA